jgi:hypothetical protein
VQYASFDASDPTAATIEDVTYALALDAAPAPGRADAAVVAASCSRESLIAFTNGQTGSTNPQRQGLNAAILDGPPPLNILQEIPEPKSQFDYSRCGMSIWRPGRRPRSPGGLNSRQTDFAAALAQVDVGNATEFPDFGAPDARTKIRTRSTHRRVLSALRPRHPSSPLTTVRLGAETLPGGDSSRIDRARSPRAAGHGVRTNAARLNSRP